jgi:hypothetical protein
MPFQPWEQPPSPRPTALSVIAIIGIVYAVLTLLCHSYGLIASMIMQNGGMTWAATQQTTVSTPTTTTSSTTQFAFAAPHDPTTMAIQVGSAIIGLVLSLFLLAGSVGALYLKSIARLTLIVYALLTLVFALARMLVTLFIVTPKMQQLLANQPMPIGRQAMQTIAAAMAVMTWLFTSALPIAILIVMTRPRVRQAFQQGAA